MACSHDQELEAKKAREAAAASKAAAGSGPSRSSPWVVPGIIVKVRGCVLPDRV